MAINKNTPASELRAERWFNFDTSSGNIVFQPLSDYYTVDVHSFKAIQGFFKAAPCSMDDFGECRLCATYDVRTCLFMQALDEEDQVAKYLKLSKTAARQFIELIEREDVEPRTTVFQIQRWHQNEAQHHTPKFNMQVFEKERAPQESDLGDMHDTLMSWMEPEYLKRFVPRYDKLPLKLSARRQAELAEGLI